MVNYFFLQAWPVILILSVQRIPLVPLDPRGLISRGRHKWMQIKPIRETSLFTVFWLNNPTKITCKVQYEAGFSGFHSVLFLMLPVTKAMERLTTVASKSSLFTRHTTVQSRDTANCVSSPEAHLSSVDISMFSFRPVGTVPSVTLSAHTVSVNHAGVDSYDQYWNNNMSI